MPIACGDRYILGSNRPRRLLRDLQMLFSNVGFIFGFLPIALGTFYVLIGRGLVDVAKLWLIAASIVFYGNFIPIHLLLLGASTVTNFFIGRRLLTKPSRGMLAAGLVFNLSILATFKYADFLVANVNALFDLALPSFGIALPLALSFFTFQKIAYLVDVHREGAPRYSFRDFVLFVVFFPQLIAGPIVHHRQIMPQIGRLGSGRDCALDLAVGATAFAIGLFKKIGIADSLATYSDSIFGAADRGVPLDLLTAWIGVLAFALQIYFDFSGYTDMALGLGRMFGITLPVNFLSPYKATNIIEFWRRWHITLSQFLRNYLYIPLGGNRHGPLRRYVNLWIVMLLGGLWHGASWTFVVWGGLHGLYLSANHGFRRLRLPKGDGRLGKIAAWSATFGAVLVAWVFFRASNFTTAFALLAAMSGHNGITLPSAAAPVAVAVPALVEALGISFGGLTYLAAGGPFNLVWLPVGLLVCLAAPNLAEWLSTWHLSLDLPARQGATDGPPCWMPDRRWGIAVGIILTFCVVYQQNAIRFLYFQF
jgi:alginate O-acetyltransferase complex protein AlgI